MESTWRLVAGGSRLILFLLIASLQAQTITVTPGTTYQTMKGWEGVEQTCQDECTNWNSYKESLLDAVVELGINRIRLEVLTNSTCTASTWNYTDLDNKINKVVNPLRTRLAAIGETLWVNLCVVDNEECYGNAGGANRPLSEYASRFRLAAQHIQSTFGWLPNSYEVALEPEVVSFWWRTSDVNNAIPLLRTELINAGITSPYIIAPSTPAGSVTFNNYFDALSTTNRGYLSELAYHRYDTVTPSHITSRATAAGVPPSMLEHYGSGHQDLHVDLKDIGVVAWERFSLAWWDEPSYRETGYFEIQGGISGTTYIMSDQTKYLRQYFKHVRLNAVRVAASSSNGNLDPVAFVNANGKTVVVVKAAASATNFTIGGLPANTYGIFYTTSSAYNQVLSNQTITAGQNITTSIPAAGVITIYALNADGGTVPRRKPSGRVTAAGGVR